MKSENVDKNDFGFGGNMKVIIEKAEITSFGCISNKTFTPSAGMNRIKAPNESGKSTYAAFIKFIFYGFGTSKKEIMDSDRKLYLPWDTSCASGAAEILADNVRYRIERKFAPSVKEEVSVINVATGKTVFEGLCPGEVFFGVNVETAEKTFIFDQYCSLTARDSQLFDSIRNIIFSSDESGNNEQAIKRLKEAKKELKNSRGNGLIEDLEKEFEKYKSLYGESMDKMAKLNEINSATISLEKNIERNNVAERKLLAEKENYENYQAYLKLKELRELEIEVENAKRAYEIAISSLEGAGIPNDELLENLLNINAEKLSKSVLADNLKGKLNKCISQVEELKAKDITGNSDPNEVKSKLSSFSGKSKLFVILGGLGLAVSVALAVLHFVDIVSLIPVSIVGLCFALICFGLGIVKSHGKKKYIKSFGVDSEAKLIAALENHASIASQVMAKEEESAELKAEIEEAEKAITDCDNYLTEVLSKYFKNVGEDASDLIKKLRTITEKVAEAKKIAESKEQHLKQTLALFNIEELTAKASKATPPERELEEIEKQLRFVVNGKKLMEDKKIQLEKEKAVLEASIAPPSVFYEKGESVYSKLLLAKERYNALDMAITLLEEASEEMKASLAPKISAYASELFRIATGGKYVSLNVTTELSLTTDNGETSKSAQYLSAGARATAYICLRLALIKVIYGEDFPPIIFDDAFARLDSKRLEQIELAINASPAKNSQVFIFEA